MKTRLNRRGLPRDYLSIYETTILHLRKPSIIAWWSVAFPGFGHILLGHYFRGIGLIIWEIFINTHSKINAAMVYSFMGNTQMANEVLNPKLVLLYIPVYLFGIWDSYRGAVELNKEYKISERKHAPIRKYKINSKGINFLDKRSPLYALIWALFIPSLGQFYQGRVLASFFTLLWTVLFIYFSNFMEGFIYFIQGNFQRSTEVLNMQWLLFIPSFYFFTIYQSYTDTVELNKLFVKEQVEYLEKNFQPSDFSISKGRLVE
ncbi:hypothetical protein [Evansella tamaricis]|uniref:Uncharacterized protein n=1 Tax=Evansella tamaricis TaxID=2069301 RepID=A0ABS6JJ48_9BACI|nr:hypothetical protein [Evansella tamaricis]MBU9713229.1 hypothetical protein [Evansella tamaricis]